jgi:hypothetical protein
MEPNVLYFHLVGFKTLTAIDYIISDTFAFNFISIKLSDPLFFYILKE